MEFIHFKIGKDDDGRRLDRVIRKFLSEDNLSQLYKSLRKGLIKVDNKKQSPDYRVSENSELLIADFLIKNNQKKQEINTKHFVNISNISVFQNEHLLILNKPYDITVHPELSNIVQNQFLNDKNKRTSLSFNSGPLHRLDRKTTGLIVFSQSLIGAKYFSELIQKHNVKKTYLAILEGKLPQEYYWTDSIEKKDEKGNHFHTVQVNTNTEKSKLTETKVIPLAYGKYNQLDITLAEFVIGTGKQHQIRAVSSFHGYPLLGDVAYNAKKIAENRFFLHAYKLNFPENSLGIPEEIICDLPKEFVKIFPYP